MNAEALLVYHVLRFRRDSDAPRPVCCPEHTFEPRACHVCGLTHWIYQPAETGHAALAERLRCPLLLICARCRIGLAVASWPC